MKSSLLIATLLTIPAAVHADPSPDFAPPSVVASAAAPTASTEYMSAGAMLGADHAIVTAVAFEGGYRLRGSLWFHGLLEKGSAAGVDEANYGGDYLAARVGLEERGCLASAICAIAGLDVGYRHVDYMADDDNLDLSGVVIVPRLGLDVGSQHLRFRPSLEGIVDGSGHDTVGFHGLALTGALAYQW